MNELEVMLEQLKIELVKLGCWQDFPIEPGALNSTEPFCINTMSLPQWLQFVLIPRLRALIEGGLSLPSGSGVLPLAQEYFKHKNNAQVLLSIINDIDDALGKAEC